MLSAHSLVWTFSIGASWSSPRWGPVSPCCGPCLSQRRSCLPCCQPQRCSAWPALAGALPAVLWSARRELVGCFVFVCVRLARDGVFGQWRCCATAVRRHCDIHIPVSTSRPCACRARQRRLDFKGTSVEDWSVPSVTATALPAFYGGLAKALPPAVLFFYITCTHLGLAGLRCSDKDPCNPIRCVCACVCLPH